MNQAAAIYASVLICVIISAYILYKAHGFEQQHLSFRIYARFALMVFIFCMASLASVPLDFQRLPVGRGIGFAVNMIYMASCSAAGYYWMCFVEVLRKSSLTDTSGKRHLWMLPMIIFVILCFTSYWTGWIFSVDATGAYHRGPAWIAQVLFGDIYLVVAGTDVIYERVRAKIDGVQNAGVLINTIFLIAGSLLQMIFGGFVLAYFACIGIVVSYVEICSEEIHRQDTMRLHQDYLEKELAQSKINEMDLRVMTAMNDDYVSMYYVSLDRDTFILYRISAQLRASVHDIVKGESLFSDVLRQYADGFVSGVDRERFLRTLSVDNILMQLEKEESFAFRYKLKENLDGPKNYEVRVARANDPDEKHMVVLGFRCIDAILAEEKLRQDELMKTLLELQNQKLLLQEALDNYKQADYDRRTDFLTGLHNRQDMFEMMRDALSCKRDMIQAMFMMDIDNFKLLNDHFGHSYGDECLMRIGRALITYEKQNNILFYRYGGEELLGIWFGGDKSADEIAQELVKLIFDLKILRDDLPAGCVTVSLGYTTNNKRYEKMIDLADRAMYKAKADGKNRAVCYENAFLTEAEDGSDQI